jgi:hypothetical protein
MRSQTAAKPVSGAHASNGKQAVSADQEQLIRTITERVMAALAQAGK